MRLFIFLVIFPAFLTAQSAFLKDPDIVWAVELEQDWVIEGPSLEVEWDSGITTLKLLRMEQKYIVDIPTERFYEKDYSTKILHFRRKESGLSSPYLAELVYEAALRKKLPIFQDADCRVPLDLSSILRDTIVTFDPVTFEESVTCAYSGIDAEERFKAWRLREVLAYHKKSATWSATVEAMAPLILLHGQEGDSLFPLFWFRPDDKPQKLTSDHIIWAKRTVNKQQKNRIPIDSLHPLKQIKGSQNPLIHFLWVVENNMKIPLYGTDNKLLSPADRLSLINRTDTFNYFHCSGPNGECIGVVHQNLSGNIHNLQLTQTWYWDDRRHRLSICLDAAAPLFDVLDNEDNFRFRKPLFYRRTRR